MSTYTNIKKTPAQIQCPLVSNFQSYIERVYDNTFSNHQVIIIGDIDNGNYALLSNCTVTSFGAKEIDSEFEKIPFGCTFKDNRTVVAGCIGKPSVATPPAIFELDGPRELYKKTYHNILLNQDGTVSDVIVYVLFQKSSRSFHYFRF